MDRNRDFSFFPELLRHAAFVTLDDMIQMLFSSLPSIAAKHAEQKAKLRETQSKQDGGTSYL